MDRAIEATRGLSDLPVEALRYASRSENPYESTGLLMSLIPEGSRVLDIGCGTGSITSLIRDVCKADIVGIEPNPERAEAAAKKGLQIVHGIYDEHTPQRLGQFDIVLFADVLEHLVDPAAMLEAVKPALTPHGRVLASIPNVAHWTVRAKLLSGSFDYRPTGIMDATHLRWFTRSSVRRLFDVAGYDIESYAGAAGGWMRAYDFTPLRFVPGVTKSRLLSKACAAWPGLFCVQHIVAASPRPAPMLN